MCCSVAHQERIAKPCSQKKSHEHGTNQSTSKLHGDLPPIGKIYHPFCRKSATHFGTKSVELRKSVTDFGEIRHRFWENQPPILGKSATDFGKNLPQTLGKSATDFGKISHRPGCEAPFLGKTGSVFGKSRLRLWDKVAPFW